MSRLVLNSERHAREGGYPEAFERFSRCDWISACAGTTNGETAFAGTLEKDEA